MTKFHPVSHIVFDMDGLLLDTEPRYDKAMSTFCQRYGFQYTNEAQMLVLGRTGRDGGEALINHFRLPITVDNFLMEIESMFEDIFKEYIPFLPGVEKLVHHLKENNIPICIATSAKTSAFKYKEKHHKKFFDLFHHIVKGPDDPEVKNGKPAPDIFLTAARRFDNPPTDMKSVLVFEDSGNGVRGGMAAGMQVVWVPAATTDTSQAEATLILTSLENFKPELFGLPPFKD